MDSRRVRSQSIHDVLCLFTDHCPLLQSRLPPEVNRILYVRNLPFKISAEEMYELFGRYGAIRQIRM